MSIHPIAPYIVYVFLALIFVGVLSYMFVYNSRLKSRKATQEKLGRPPVTREEGIAVATDNKEKAGKSGTL